MNFLVAYPATLAAKRERLIMFRCVIGKKRVAKKNVITTGGNNRIPTPLKQPLHCEFLATRLVTTHPNF